MIAFDRLLALAAGACGVSVGDIRADRHDAPAADARDLVCWLAIAYGDRSAQAVGRALGGLYPQAVRKARDRVELASRSSAVWAARTAALAAACVAQTDLARVVGVSAVERQMRIALPTAARQELGVALGGRVDAAWGDDIRTLGLWPGSRHKVIGEGRMLLVQVVLPPVLHGVVTPRLRTPFAPRIGGGIVIDVPEEILAWQDDEPDDDQPTPALPAHVRFDDDRRAQAECGYDTRGSFA